jgi:LmbE family N-acetylglucosaminyl deacetylase
MGRLWWIALAAAMFCVWPNHVEVGSRPDGSRVLVVAPHPDDESLAAAGYMLQALHRGAQVRLVWMTDGDAFRAAARRFYGLERPSRNDMKQLGMERRKEAEKAAHLLGVASKDCLFLGFPDGGLDSLWRRHFISPSYRSPFTGRQMVPSGSAVAGASYTGEAVVDVLTRVIRSFHPTEILFPDSRDHHPDHWATSLFVELALRKAAVGAKEYEYLVHGGWDWPYPEQGRFFLLRPSDRTADGVTWKEIRLTNRETVTKRGAILAHRSQVMVMGGFLQSFARGNEWYSGKVPLSSSHPVQASISEPRRGTPGERSSDGQGRRGLHLVCQWQENGLRIQLRRAEWVGDQSVELVLMHSADGGRGWTRTVICPVFWGRRAWDYFVSAKNVAHGQSFFLLSGSYTERQTAEQLPWILAKF